MSVVWALVIRYYHRVLARRILPSISRRLGTTVAFLQVVGCSNITSSPDLVTQAEADLEVGRYDQAIEAYRSHRDERLEASDRPDWENPHFYTLLMGDVELRRDQPERAMQLYQQAEREQVTPTLVTDRYRAIATWHTEHDQLDEAMTVLKTHRARDPLLFDAMLDKVAKKMTARENSRLLGSRGGAPHSR